MIQTLQGLGSALNSGNLAAAQADFSQLVASSGNAGTNTILTGGSDGATQIGTDPNLNPISPNGTWTSNDPGGAPQLGNNPKWNPISPNGTWTSNDPGGAPQLGNDPKWSPISQIGTWNSNDPGGGSASTNTILNGSISGSPVQTDMNALGSALNSGNSASAKSAFGQLEQDLLSGLGHHHHHHGSFGMPPSTSTSSSASPTSDPSSSSASQLSPAVSAIASLAQAGSTMMGGGSLGSLLSLIA
jgi:hypothetical protein